MNPGRKLISEEEHAEILSEIEHLETIAKNQLHSLGLTTGDLENIDAFELYKDGEFRGHEAADLQCFFMALAEAKRNLYENRIVGLFKAAVALGECLPRGNPDPNEISKIKWAGRHPYDVLRNTRKTRSRTGGQKEKDELINKLYQPFILKRAKALYKKNPDRPLKTNKTNNGLSISEQIAMDLNEKFSPAATADILTPDTICRLIRKAKLNPNTRPGRLKTTK
jgi:hypothetical protein